MNIRDINPSPFNGENPLDKIKNTSVPPQSSANSPPVPTSAKDVENQIDYYMSRIMTIANSLKPPAPYNKNLGQLLGQLIFQLRDYVQSALTTSIPGIGQLSSMIPQLNGMADCIDDEDQKFDFSDFMSGGQYIRENFFSFLKNSLGDVSLPLNPMNNITQLQTEVNYLNQGKDLNGQDIMTSDGQDITKLLSKYLPQMTIFQAMQQYMNDTGDLKTTQKIAAALENVVKIVKITAADAASDMVGLADAGFKVDASTISALSNNLSTLDSVLSSAASLNLSDDIYGIITALFKSDINGVTNDWPSTTAETIADAFDDIKNSLGPWSELT